ncbi:hypothetical protein AMECASPLE_035657 [Ameca splendens]|uniref:Uncharacterized protein n=1 Tax=Ameca splendens TaxID=208324 RepID=A0ABV0YUI7_9TELE
MSLVCLSKSKLFAGFLVHHLRCPLGTTAMQTNFAVCNLTIVRLTPATPLTSALLLATRISLFKKKITGYDAEHVHPTSFDDHRKACSVKPLWGLGHHAAAQFQSVGNLIA